MSASKIRVAIIGASGYTGEELVRILLRHPFVDITTITSRENAGNSIGSVFPRHIGSNLTFSMPDADTIAASAELVFLCLPHGLATEFAVPLINHGLTVFDISADFRLKSPELYNKYYGGDHPAPSLLAQAVYGLPEKYRNRIKTAKLIACPGCYPTSAIIPIHPLIRDKVSKSEGIKVCGMSGVTGAGRKIAQPYLFPECNESIRSYSLTGHRHIPEIEQELTDSGGENARICFSAHLMPVNRGLHSTIYLPARHPEITKEEIQATMTRLYDGEPFVRILPPGKLADTKNVTYTNVCEIGFDVDKRTGTIVLTSAIDNLFKGASGQAVQCMNIVCGFEEETGLV